MLNQTNNPVASLNVCVSELDQVKSVILENCAIYGAFARSYRDGGEKDLANSFDGFIAAHGKFLKDLEQYELTQELKGSFGDEGYQPAELPAKLELTQENIQDGRISAMEILGDYIDTGYKTRRAYNVLVDGTVSFFTSIRELMGNAEESRAYQNNYQQA